MRLTKQGVRDLNTGSAPKHIHRYVPKTYTDRGGRQLTRMECFCGDIVSEGTEEERRKAAALEREAEYESDRYGWGQRR